jgi:hypothetical protein
MDYASEILFNIFLGLKLNSQASGLSYLIEIYLIPDFLVDVEARSFQVLRFEFVCIFLALSKHFCGAFVGAQFQDLHPF